MDLTIVTTFIPIEFVSGVSERIVGVRRGRTRGRSEPVRRLWPPCIEAMCTGTPLVATDGGALPEVTGADGETVFRCTAGDVSSLATSIHGLLTNQRPVPQLGLLADSVSPSAGRGGTAPNSPLTNTEKFSTCPATLRNSAKRTAVDADDQVR